LRDGIVNTKLTYRDVLGKMVFTKLTFFFLKQNLLVIAISFLQTCLLTGGVV